MSEVVKASIVDVSARSNAAPVNEDDARLFAQHQAIPPPYEPRALHELYERSASLRPVIEAYVTNVDGFGHRLEPLLSLKEAAFAESVRDALAMDQIAQGGTGLVTPEDVEANVAMLPHQIRMEGLRLKQWFDSCAGEISFTELRSRTRMDREVTGNAYWEVLRDDAGQIAQFVFLPSSTMRLLRAEPNYTKATQIVRSSPLGLTRRSVHRRFRRYVQVIHGQFVAYFKEMGDARIMGARTGRVYESIEQLQAGGEIAATEVLHFPIFSPASSYGVPRWVGATLAVLGSRAADEVNVSYFDNKAVPPMAILVSGGALAKDATERIREYLRDNVKGVSNYHSVLVLEAESASGTMSGPGSARCRIEIKSLMDAQNKDALFLQYDERNADKVGNQYRLPRLMRGDTRDFNRATADAALLYAEQQVFAPERTSFDQVINTRVMPELNARFTAFVSNGVAVRDSEVLNSMIALGVERGFLTPNEARELAAEVFNRPFEEIPEDWAKRPLPITLAGSSGAVAGRAPSLSEEAARLVQLRATLAETERRVDEAATREAREEGSRKVVIVPDEVFASWVRPSAEG